MGDTLEADPEAWEQPARNEEESDDLEVRITDDQIEIFCVTAGKEQVMKVSKWNASRVFACLALALGIPLPKGLKLSLGRGFRMEFSWDRPPASLGEKVARHILVQRVKKAFGDG